MIAITGASGQLGRLVIDNLLRDTAPAEIVAIVRQPQKIAGLSARGVQARQADYNDPGALTEALQGVEKLLLISSSEVGKRTEQHRNVISAAQQAGVKLIAYTSLLHADSSPLGLATEHIATEKLLAESGIDRVLLRNGWYTENYLASVPAALQHGVFIGSAGTGRIASASRAGLPEGLAAMLANSDAGAARGGLFDESRQLSALIGRPTTPMAESLRASLHG